MRSKSFFLAALLQLSSSLVFAVDGQQITSEINLFPYLAIDKEMGHGVGYRGYGIDSPYAYQVADAYSGRYDIFDNTSCSITNPAHVCHHSLDELRRLAPNYYSIYVWRAEGWQLQIPSRCMVHGPYRRHTNLIDGVVAKIRVGVILDNDVLSQRDSIYVAQRDRHIDDAIIFTLNIQQSGREYAARDITFRELAQDDGASVVGINWKELTISAENIPPDVNGGYEVRICQKFDATYEGPEGRTYVVSNILVSKYYIFEHDYSKSGNESGGAQ